MYLGIWIWTGFEADWSEARYKLGPFGVGYLSWPSVFPFVFELTPVKTVIVETLFPSTTPQLSSWKKRQMYGIQSIQTSYPELEMTMMQSNRKRINMLRIFTGSFLGKQYNRKWQLFGFWYKSLYDMEMDSNSAFKVSFHYM